MQSTRPSLISLMVSVDIKHHVYLLQSTILHQRFTSLFILPYGWTPTHHPVFSETQSTTQKEEGKKQSLIFCQSNHPCGTSCCHSAPLQLHESHLMVVRMHSDQTQNRSGPKSCTSSGKTQTHWEIVASRLFTFSLRLYFSPYCFNFILLYSFFL